MCPLYSSVFRFAHDDQRNQQHTNAGMCKLRPPWCLLLVFSSFSAALWNNQLLDNGLESSHFDSVSGGLDRILCKLSASPPVNLLSWMWMLFINDQRMKKLLALISDSFILMSASARYDLSVDFVSLSAHLRPLRRPSVSVSNICWDFEWPCWCLVVRSSRSLGGSFPSPLAAEPGWALITQTQR